LSLLSDLISGKSSSGYLDHGANLVLKVDASFLDNLVGSLNNGILNKLKLLNLAYERNHDLGNDVPLGMTSLNGDGSLDYSLSLHNSDLGVGYCKAASAVTHHR